MSKSTRRSFIKNVGIVGTAAGIGSGFSLTIVDAEESGGPWTTFRGGAGRTGATSDSGPATNIATEWSFDLNGGMHTVEPIIADGLLYLAVTTQHTPSTGSGYVAAYDPQTQSEVWRFDGISPPETPTYENGVLYFGTNGSESSNSSGFFALDAATGEQKWNKEDSSGLTNPLIVNGRLFASGSGRAGEHDLNTGEVIWQTDVASGPACFADDLLFYENGIALNADDGSMVWNVSSEKERLQTVSNGIVFGVKNTSNSKVVIKARSSNDGSVHWSYSAETEVNWANPRLTIADNNVLFHTGKTIYALDVGNGEETWSYDANATISGALSVGNGILYAGGRSDFGTDTGNAVVLALDAASGKQQWRHEFGGWNFEEYGPAANSPIVANGKIYTSTYPMNSTTDWMYTEYGNFHVLGRDVGSNTTKTTTKKTTTSSTNTNTTSTKTDTGSTTRSTVTGSTKSSSSTKIAQTTETSGTTVSSTMSTTGPTKTTSSNGQPGFGTLTAIGGLSGLVAYLRSSLE
ncbi:PQQ-binding-like beta-propeller repeat protein [Haladaptatus sp. DYF46]|uniref:outer membrane protein assembly factor BamB family protein n=1 Tax=Haladaptatus sp. DYF46 TaxID=2886041 RepID=UPI001E42F4A4|nr:PQQ-binding-like beta-propeller repeat protein [Haladaptatus sp. DYF46]